MDTLLDTHETLVYSLTNVTGEEENGANIFDTAGRWVWQLDLC